jgi:anthranilate synthase/aminodeoxychorismate synthase-like glutamine amidotransferase
VKLLVVDFYDSFTYNLVHYLEGLDCVVTTILEDKIDLNDLLNYDAIILAPGPGLPNEKKNLFNILELCENKIPVLGICLGMQGIAEFLGMELENQQQVKHGVSEEIQVFSKMGLFNDLSDKISVGLYHSWKVKKAPIENITAISENKVIMALEFPEKKLYGVQFHPESIMTTEGKKILQNFIFMAKKINN